MIPALIVGALTAWYLGVRTGIIAAVITLVALIVAQFVPGLTLAVYALVVAWTLAVYFLGAKITGRVKGPSMLGGMANQASAWVKKNLKL